MGGGVEPGGVFGADCGGDLADPIPASACEGGFFVLDEEKKCLSLVEGMVQQGRPVTIERLDDILRDHYERLRFLEDDRVDATIRSDYAQLIERAQHDLEASNVLWSMKWFVMQCRLNPVFARKRDRLLSFMAPR